MSNFNSDDVDALIKLKRAQALEKAMDARRDLDGLSALHSEALTLVSSGSFGRPVVGSGTGTSTAPSTPLPVQAGKRSVKPPFSSLDEDGLEFATPLPVQAGKHSVKPPFSSLDEDGLEFATPLEEEHPDTPVSQPTAAAEKFTGGCSVVDHWAASHPREFPNGDVSISFSQAPVSWHLRLPSG